MLILVLEHLHIIPYIIINFPIISFHPTCSHTILLFDCSCSLGCSFSFSFSWLRYYYMLLLLVIGYGYKCGCRYWVMLLIFYTCLWFSWLQLVCMHYCLIPIQLLLLDRLVSTYVMAVNNMTVFTLIFHLISAEGGDNFVAIWRYRLLMLMLGRWKRSGQLKIFALLLRLLWLWLWLCL